MPLINLAVTPLAGVGVTHMRVNISTTWSKSCHKTYMSTCTYKQSGLVFPCGQDANILPRRLEYILLFVLLQQVSLQYKLFKHCHTRAHTTGIGVAILERILLNPCIGTDTRYWYLYLCIPNDVHKALLLQLRCFSEKCSCQQSNKTDSAAPLLLLCCETAGVSGLALR